MSRKEALKELLSFTKSEKRGIGVLIFLLALITSLRFFMPLSGSDVNKEKAEDFFKQIAAFEQQLEKRKPKEYLNRLDKAIIARYDTLQLFDFNPNNASDADWLKLGLTKKQISTINNYRNKGGKFYDKEDFRRIYGIRTKQFQILKPYIQLPEKSNYYASDDYSRYDKAYQYKNDEDDEIPEPKELFDFNPNNISAEKWTRLGFSKKQISTIENYLSKGGRFYKKEDLQKIYGIKDFQYERVKDYIKIPSSEDTADKRNDNEEAEKSSPVNINKLSGEEFVALGGFWKYNGERIAKYRQLLGGFHKKDQLLEVWGVKEKYYKHIKDDIRLGNVSLRKININTATVEELAAHPYIEYHNAEDIFEFKVNNGFYKDVSLLRKHKIISQTTYDKVKPYLKIR